MPGTKQWVQLARRRVLGFVLGAALVLLDVATGSAQEDRGWLRVESWGLNMAYGSAYRHSIQFYSLLPHIDLCLPNIIDEPLAQYNVHAQWVVEPFASYVTDASDTEEAGVNLAILMLRYDRGQPLVPFIEGGVGVLYSGLRERGLGTHFLFSLPVGAGLEWFFTRTTALSAMYRFRHISNAGISSHNTGLNADFFMLGLTYFPQR